MPSPVRRDRLAKEKFTASIITFFPNKSFQKVFDEGNFLEQATVYGNSYGTLKSEVNSKLSAGQDVLLNIDVQGAEHIRKTADASPLIADSLVSVFLATSSLGELENRLRKRAQDEEEVIQRRLSVAKEELNPLATF